jgi:hypothetical protein
MSRPRFTVRECRGPIGYDGGMIDGWAVFDRGRRITIPFADYADAIRHRDNIRALYLRWGW